ncbi:amino acid ABC transporter substrate-binding protein [Rhodoferax sp.]|uniref:amino acid ABC transporter substrate-binding protein n=1 Tax=Rhodoferax sp. TaxID=50421 RepID=UPI00374C9801
MHLTLPQRLASALLALALAQTAAAGELDKIRASGEITLAHRNTSIPFSYQDADGKPMGYAVDLCLKIADAVKRELKMSQLTVKYLLVTPDKRLSAISEGQASLECGSTTNNAERRKVVDFTIPHFVSMARLLVRSDAHVESMAQLAGRTVVSTKGTTPLVRLRRANDDGALKMKIIEAPDHAQAFAMVAAGQAEAFAMDDVLLFGLRANAIKPEDFTVIGKPLTIEPYAIMLPKDDPAFKKVVDQEMRRIILSGEIYPLYAKWFQQPIPPKGINLALPMQHMLKDMLKYPSDKVGDLN